MKRDEPVEDDEAPPVIESAAYDDQVDEFDSDESTLELGGHVPEPEESQWTGWVGWSCAESYMIDKLFKINIIILVRWIQLTLRRVI